MKYLVEDMKADIEEVDRTWGSPPLHHACRKNQAEAASYLLQKGANVNATSTTQHCSALHLAAGNGNRSLVELLLDHGADKDTTDKVDAHKDSPVSIRTVRLLFISISHTSSCAWSSVRFYSAFLGVLSRPSARRPLSSPLRSR